MSENYTFYAFNVNGHTATIFSTPEEALDELTMRLKEDDSDTYAIEPIDGIFRTLERMADFDGRYDDVWMEVVIQKVCQMVFNKNELAESKGTLPENKNSKK